jgi:glycosyltransferase involved in cell wall biosynthesis
MKILVAHNFYQQSGGEDTVFAAETELLTAHGHDVVKWTDTNHRIDQGSKFAAARNAIWSFEAFKKAEELISLCRPDLVHVHNTWMILSPSIYSAFQKNGIPVVQTLHNYRLLCPNALFFRDGKVCEECMNFSVPISGIVHKCYRESVSQTSIVAAMLSYHRLAGTWLGQVDRYIALSEFAKAKFIQGGLPPEKLHVKPNFLPDVDFQIAVNRDHVLYAGRLSPEKGISTLERAWREPLLADVPLHVAGDGPEKEVISQLSLERSNVRYLGKLDRRALDEAIIRSRFVVIPSVCYENFPMGILDAFRLGVPVIASRLGSMMELVREGETGLLFTPGDAADLAAKVKWLWLHPEDAERMGRIARSEYEQKYTSERNYEMLMQIYGHAIKEKRR